MRNLCGQNTSITLENFKMTKTGDILFKSFYTNKLVKIKNCNIKLYFKSLLNLSDYKCMKLFIDTNIINILPNNVKVVSENIIEKVTQDQLFFFIICSYKEEEFMLEIYRRDIFTNDKKCYTRFNIQYRGKIFKIIEEVIKYIESLNFMLDYVDVKNIVCRHSIDNIECRSCNLRQIAKSRDSLKKLALEKLHEDLNKYLFTKKYKLILEEIKNWPGFKKSTINCFDENKYTLEHMPNLSTKFKNNSNLLKICGVKDFLTYFSNDLSKADIDYLNKLNNHES